MQLHKSMFVDHVIDYNGWRPRGWSWKWHF